MVGTRAAGRAAARPTFAACRGRTAVRSSRGCSSLGVEVAAATQAVALTGAPGEMQEAQGNPATPIRTAAAAPAPRAAAARVAPAAGQTAALARLGQAE